MTTPTTPGGVPRHRGRILLGSAGDGDDWSTFHGHVEDLGWQVVIFDAVPRLDGDSIEAALPAAQAVDLAVVVVARSDRRVDLLTSRRLNHLVGVLQGQLGFGRVLVLTENEIEGFLHGTGVTEVRYERGRIRARFPQLDALLEDLMGGSEPPDREPHYEEHRSLWQRMGLFDDGVQPEMLVSAGVLILLVAVLIVSAWQFAGGAADTSGDLSAERAGPSTAGEPADPTVSGDGASGGGDPAGPTATVSATPAGGGGVDAGASSGDVGSLPASCTVDTSDGVMLPDVISCDGIGGLRVQGDRGPWHDRLASVSADQGVVGHLELAAVDDPTVGTVTVTAQQPAIVPAGGGGVRSVRLQFSSDGQQVTLQPVAGSGSGQTVLTFSLDL